MRLSDLLVMALAALWRQKGRTALTLLGVAVGAFSLVCSLAVGTGVRAAVAREFSRNDQLRQIHVSAGAGSPGEAAADDPDLQVKGDMSDAKRQRIRLGLRRRLWWKFDRPRLPLTRERLQVLADLDHVATVIPVLQEFNLQAAMGDKVESVQIAAVPADNSHIGNRLVAGAPLEAGGRGILVSEFLLYRLGIASDAEVERALGKSLHLEFRGGGGTPVTLLYALNSDATRISVEELRGLEKVLRQLPDVLDKMDLTPEEIALLRKRLASKAVDRQSEKSFRVEADVPIIGVIREMTDEEQRAVGWSLDRVNRDAEVVLPLEAGLDLFGRLPYRATNGFDGATVVVDSEDHVQEVVGKIRDLGLGEYDLLEVLDRVQRNVMLISFATAFIAAVALLVACLGITNTMLMSVLERTHEIGVMKAVGARDRQVMGLFLIEGLWLGLVGGALGLFLGWLASFPGDAIGRRLMEEQTHNQLEQSLFAFPLGLTLGVPLFAGLVTTLAALYPARRAAGVKPIIALRHE